MNRRDFLKSAAVVAAPWVITSSGILMPVKTVWSRELIILHANNRMIFCSHGPIDNIAVADFMGEIKLYNSRGQRIPGTVQVMHFDPAGIEPPRYETVHVKA